MHSGYKDCADKTWPLFYKALQEGVNKDFYKPTFVEIAGCLGLMIKVENITTSDLDKEYCAAKIQALFSYAFGMIKEVEENEVGLEEKIISNVKLIMNGFKKVKIVTTALTIVLSLFGMQG